MSSHPAHPAAAIDGEGKKEKKEGAGAPHVEKKTDESRLEAIKRKQKEREEKQVPREKLEQKAQLENKVLRALKALHKMKIVHRDIKAANIFISKKEDSNEECIEDINIKLGDLNVSKIAKMGLMST